MFSTFSRLLDDLPATGIEVPDVSKNPVRKGVLRSLQMVVTKI